ncbi:MAG: Gfo/Idh/MocA family oxidoreductase, partial [Planctomycetes bacterium]|nr:Gfo/Idh/MocA family oxidoreductase [Planctomycetota bacterium]
WIATPDHWHATITMDAMEAGKDVYCEKPMTLYWHEAKAVYETALRTRRILQVGAQGTSGPGWDKANELIREGKIGKVLWSQTSSSRNSKGGEWNYGIDQGVSPSNLDWDRFIGPAQWRPFDPERYFRFRKYWDYSGGTATDLFSHYLYALMKALGPELPSSVVSGGGNWVHKDREVPDTFHMLAQYPSGHTVLAVSSMANEQGVSTLIRGQQATMYPGGGGVTIRREPAFLEEGEETGGEIKVSVPHPGDILKAHANNLFECMRTRAKTNCHAELAYKTTVAIALSVASYRENRVKVFDPVREQLVS